MRQQIALDFGPRPVRRGTPLVFLVLMDANIRHWLETLIRRAGWGAATLMSSDELPLRPAASGLSCLIVDTDAPGLEPFALQQQVATERPEMPIIFIAGQNDVSLAVRAMKGGAIDVLTKPVSDEHMLDAVQQALLQSEAYIGQAAELQELRARYEFLSRREQEVMALIVAGLMNKQVAGDLGISEITVKAHRGKVMRKMQAGSFADLVRMADKLRLAN